MGHLSQQQIEQFQKEGYLIVEDLFDPAADIDPIIEEYKSVLDNLSNELYANHEISSTYADLPFGQRLIEIYKESGKVHPFGRDRRSFVCCAMRSCLTPLSR